MNGLYAFLLWGAAVTDLGVFGWLLTNKTADYLRYLRYFLLALAVWSFTYGLFWLVPDLRLRYYLLDATYLGVLYAPPFYFLFALDYTNQPLPPLRWRRVLFAVPTLLLVIMWTDRWHGLFFGGLRVPDASVLFDGGFFFWLNVFYGYSLILIATVLLTQYALQQLHTDFRRQIVLLLLAIMLPVAVNAGLVLGVIPRLDVDLTPILFSLTALIVFFNLREFFFGSLQPVGYRMVLSQIATAFLILDREARVVAFNAAAQRMLPPSIDLAIGMKVQEILQHLPAKVREVLQQMDTETVVQIGDRYYKLRSTLMRRRPDDPGSGRLLMWQDISFEMRINQQLTEANDRLQREIAQQDLLQAQLAEQALRDGLTDMHNRRFLVQELPRLLESIQQRGGTLALCFVDIDHFKQINDRYGHAIGDAALIAVAQHLRCSLRTQDWVVRYGGDEFVVVLPDIERADAIRRLDNLRRGAEKLNVRDRDGEPVRLSLSLGVAFFPQDAADVEDLLHCADDALYHVKLHGRNRLGVFDQGVDKSHHDW